MYGWYGRIASVNLSEGKCGTFSPDYEILTKFIGGKGLAGYYLKEHVTLDWNDPAMPLLLFTGPLVNTRSPTSGRMSVMSRSPLTGTIGDSSVGGSFGTELKKAGFDGMIITGKSDRLCGIEIDDGRIRIVSALHMAGMQTGSARLLLKDKGSSAIIGPAAENGVRFSNIIFDGHFAAGRNGLGLVFASKGIKYITVRGVKKTKISDPKELDKAREDVFRLVSASPALSGKYGISNYGTAALFDLMNARRMTPTDNFRKSFFEQERLMNAPSLKKTYRPKKRGCRGCHIMCKKITGDGTVIPEFETLSHFSALVVNRNIETVIEANRICNETGMDTISAAATLSCYSEIEGKALAPSDITALLNDIAYKRGEGEPLGTGAARFAGMRGRPETAMTVKGQELPAYDPRGAYGMALSYATSTRGGCHLRAYPISHEILRKPVATDRFTFEGKARIIKNGEDLNAAADSLTACKFIFFAASLEEYSRVFQAVTGVNCSGHDLLKAGERICYNERMMNALNGFSAKDDDLPERFFRSSGHENDEIASKPIDRKDFLWARANYYRARGLDENGMPIHDIAKKLGLL
jgi:aldehyde:ferredoxin oxidoreductase